MQEWHKKTTLTHHLVSSGTDTVGVTGLCGGLGGWRDVGSVSGLRDRPRPGKGAWLVGRRGRRSRCFLGDAGGWRGVWWGWCAWGWGVSTLLIPSRLAVWCQLRWRAGLCRRLWGRMVGRLDRGLVTWVASGCGARLWGGGGGRGGWVAGPGPGSGADRLGRAGGGGMVHWITGLAGWRVCRLGRGRGLLLGTWNFMVNPLSIVWQSAC